MSEQHVFSFATMKACNGNAQSDGEYLKWFVSEYGKRLSSATNQLASFVSGEKQFTESTLSLATALRAEVRQISQGLKELKTWFAMKESIAANFDNLHQKYAEQIKKAEADYLTLQKWFQ